MFVVLLAGGSAGRVPKPLKTEPKLELKFQPFPRKRHTPSRQRNRSFNHLTLNGHFSGRTSPLTYRRYILYIYLTNIRTEYFKHAAHSPIFPFQNVVYFIMLPFLVPVLFTF
jgi:hypothetical protein